MNPEAIPVHNPSTCSNIFDYVLVKNKSQIIPYSFAHQKLILPIEQEERGMRVAMSNPLDIDTIQELRLYLRQPILPIYCPQPLLEAAIEYCFSQKEGEAKRLFSDVVSSGEGLPNVLPSQDYDLLDEVNPNPIIRMVNAILLEAIQQRASDIHLEPGDQEFLVRYRIDGTLQKRAAPPKEVQAAILTRIKVMAQMDIAEQRLPQDGRIKLRQGARDIDFRISTIPTIHGERVVLRILDRGNVVLGLEKIGMSRDILTAFRKFIQMPEGIVLVTGPTGSGKTTTLYSAITEINTGEMNILTIEDPVEYKLPGISQINVNPRIELDFAKGLRHILRQDPDIIMIGEIRDRETAEIAIQASLTGHLVLSTLHTNDTASSLTRLSDMGVEPYLLSSSILAVLAQRLVRCICSQCRIEYIPSVEELTQLGLTETHVKVDYLWRGQGCISCLGSGYKGRYGVYELMPMHNKIKTQVMKSVDAEAIRFVSRGCQMTSLFEYGRQLMLSGITTSAEVLRVTRMTETY